MLSYATLACCLLALIRKHIVGYRLPNLFINRQIRVSRALETKLYVGTADTDISRAKLGGRIASILKGSMVGREHMLKGEEYVHFPSFGTSSQSLRHSPEKHFNFENKDNSSFREVIASTAAATSLSAKGVGDFLEKESGREYMLAENGRGKLIKATNTLSDAAHAKPNHEKQRSLFRVIKGHIEKNRLSGAIKCLRDRTEDLSETELNYLATDTLRCLGSRGAATARHCADVLEVLESSGTSPDIYTYTSAMSVYNKHHLYEEVLEIFDKIVASSEHQLDTKFYVNAVRAVGHARPWRSIIDMLDGAYKLLGENVLTVVHSALTNLKYADKGPASSPMSVQHAYALLLWMNERQIQLRSHTLDIVLAVMCTHGSVEDAEKVLMTFAGLGLEPTQYTYNTVLDRCAVHGHIEGALHVIESMSSKGLAPDSTTYNTLLKLCVSCDDLMGAQEIVETMESLHVSVSDYTKVSMIRLYKSNGFQNAAQEIIDTEPDDTVTTHMFVNAIKSADGWRQAVSLLQRANNIGKADEAVFAAAAQACFKAQQFSHGFKIVKVFRQKGYRENKFMLSTVVGACLEYFREGGPGLVELEKHLDMVHDKYHHLLTHSVCQKIVRDLSQMRQSELAASFHVRYLPHCTCSSNVLLDLFTDLQSTQMRNRYNDVEKRQQLAKLGLAVVGLYTLPASKTGVQVRNSLSTNNRSRLVRTQHLNRLLRLLTNAKMYSEAKNIFALMRNSTDAANTSDYRTIHDDFGDSRERGLSSVWRPTTFTIAELIRVARASDDPCLVSEVMDWGLREAVLLPEGVISDSISYLFAVGQNERTINLYYQLYDAGKINHWSDRENLELDLHSFSRGMAFAAITCAMEEAKDMEQAYTNAGEVEVLPGTLTVITGRSEKTRGTVSEEAGEAFVLSAEIQNVLIESFYPPVSSFTVPGNAGRLLVPYSEHQDQGEA